MISIDAGVEISKDILTIFEYVVSIVGDRTTPLKWRVVDSNEYVTRLLCSSNHHFMAWETLIKVSHMEFYLIEKNGTVTNDYSVLDLTDDDSIRRLVLNEVRKRYGL